MDQQALESGKSQMTLVQVYNAIADLSFFSLSFFLPPFSIQPDMLEYVTLAKYS
jgi:hypothetical protein